MKELVILCIFMWFYSGLAMAQDQGVLNRTLSLHLESTSVHEVLDTLEKLVDVSFAYDPRKLPLQKLVQVKSEDKALKTILDEMFTKSGVSFSVAESQVSLFRNQSPNFTLYGQIKDIGSGEALIGANVFETVEYQGTSSNSDGYYSLTLSEGNYILYTSYIGFEDRIDTVRLYSDQYMDLELTKGQELNEVVVIEKIPFKEATVALHRSNRGEEIIDVSHAKSLPTSLSESDPMGIVRLLPGFVAGGSARQNTYVRGGNADQNLVLLDGVPLYNLNHGAGNFSIFNGAAINEVEIYTNNIPARYGDRLSSVIDVKMREGNNQKLHGGAMVGLTSASMFVEGPLIKNKASFLIAGRRSWSDLFLGLLTNTANTNANSFYDVNVKLNYHVSKKDRMHVSFYQGSDLLRSSTNRSVDTPNSINKQRTRWGNTAAAVRWHRKFNPKVFTNFSVQFNDFGHTNTDERFLQSDQSQRLEELKYSSLIRESRILADAIYIPSVKHRINFGGQFAWRNTDPGSITNIKYSSSDSVFHENTIEKIKVNEGVLFVEEEYKLNDHWSFRGGLRLTYLSVQGKNYFKPNIRSHIGYAINSDNRIDLSFDQNIQFMHLLSIEGNALQNEKWLSTTKRVSPEYADQLSLNYTFVSNRIKLKVGGYYKKMRNLLLFNQLQSTFDNYRNWEEQVASGTGRSHGLEFLLAKLNGKTNGWISYTWSKSSLQYAELNDGNRFPHRYDRRHNMNIAITHSLRSGATKQRYFGVVWTFATGHWVTLPIGSIVDPIDGSRAPVYREVNNARVKNFHQLSISFNKDRKTSNGHLATWRYGIQNIYLRNNQDSPGIVFNDLTNKFEVNESGRPGIPIPFISFSYTF